jgi:flagellar biosynthesis/type III secretory pathway chaperone
VWIRPVHKLLVANVQQRAKTPNGCRSESDYKSQPNRSARQVSLAPALEHSNQSNQKQHNGDRAENFEKHATPPSKGAYAGISVAGSA